MFISFIPFLKKEKIKTKITPINCDDKIMVKNLLLSLLIIEFSLSPFNQHIKTVIFNYK